MNQRQFYLNRTIKVLLPLYDGSSASEFCINTCKNRQPPVGYINFHMMDDLLNERLISDCTKGTFILRHPGSFPIPLTISVEIQPGQSRYIPRLIYAKMYPVYESKQFKKSAMLHTMMYQPLPEQKCILTQHYFQFCYLINILI